MTSLPPRPSPAELDAQIRAAIAAGDPNKSNEWENAFHEAGHVVVLVRLGGAIPYAVYLNDGGGAGDDHAGRTIMAATFDFGQACADDIEDDELRDRFRDGAKVQGAVLAAGRLAEDLACGREPDLEDLVAGVTPTCLDTGGRDERELSATALGWADRDTDTWVEDRFSDALSCLREHWADVELVARALVGHRHLDHADLFDLLFADEREGTA